MKQQLFKTAFVFPWISIYIFFSLWKSLCTFLMQTNPRAQRDACRMTAWALEGVEGWPWQWEFPPLRNAAEAHVVGRSWKALPTWSTMPKTHHSPRGGAHTTMLHGIWHMAVSICDTRNWFQHGSRRTECGSSLSPFGYLGIFFPHTSWTETGSSCPFCQKSLTVWSTASSLNVFPNKETLNPGAVSASERKSNHWSPKVTSVSHLRSPRLSSLPFHPFTFMFYIK